MAVQMPFSMLLFVHRLVRSCTSSQRHHRQRDVLVNFTKGIQEIRRFSTGPVKFNSNRREDSDSSAQSDKSTSRQALVGRRRRRPLSPLERISGLLPPDALSPEVVQLREQSQQEAEEGTGILGSVTHCTQEKSGHPETLVGEQSAPVGDKSDNYHVSDIVVTPNPSRGLISATLPGERLLTFGEFLVAEYYKKEQVEFKKMFRLQTSNHLHSNWGFISHDDIAGQPAGQVLKTHIGVPILIRRASLEDFVLHMKRGPAIAYPKDAATMMMMMDVAEGDSVLESGSGSGAMSLFLSRAVGSKGSVLSVEVRQDHLKRAVLNYNLWRTSWSLRRGEEWPDNVQFHNADLCTASSLLAGQGFHAMALDLTNPQLVLPAVTPHLHPGAVCAIYLANITQVVDLLEGIRFAVLPLLCEHIVEVPIRHWLVTSAVQKNGQYCTRKAPILQAEEEEGEWRGAQTDKEGLTADEHPAFGSVPYIARPRPHQPSHTAFLVKLRKCVP
ncbi:tRNA (adenine(58)-N(1))-methyltransferase, mitochondrial [Echeneis naucrates]|uniref:tRNA (adenine(58)-N(1))-methyltransferase n=1 Tax=Echeneis naucrates TaxID=173247 RepID=A0A665V737_ECHNA|nr:tRNA (adenine(58)-N(1))-methyltransferase, mitochondrial [Echeneis naucrates]XP_029350035.1 tRNA (adenine(58)-N(1))-methyltransferase, mitochondrial [Echeneis naucrates]